MRFFTGNSDNIKKTINIEEPSTIGAGVYSSFAELHYAHLKFIIEKDGDYLGFGCKKFSYFKKQSDDTFKEYQASDNFDFANILIIEGEYLYMIKN